MSIGEPRTDRGFWWHAFLAGGGLWRVRVHGGRGATLPSAGAAAEAAVHDLAGQVQDRGVVVQDEVGVGGQDDPVQFEGEPVGVLSGGKFVLGDGGGRLPPVRVMHPFPEARFAATHPR